MENLPHTFILQAILPGLLLYTDSHQPYLLLWPLGPVLLNWHMSPKMASLWLCAHMVQNCLLSEAVVPCESWGPAPGGSDDSGQ